MSNPATAMKVQTLDNVTRLDRGRQISSAMLLPASQARNSWRLALPDTFDIGNLTNPFVWAMVVRQLNIGDVIECITRTAFSTFLVRFVDVTHGQAVVTEISRVPLPTVDMKAMGEAKPYRVKFAGDIDKWTVERVTDGAVQARGLKDETAANNWIAERESKLQPNTVVVRG